MKDHYVSTIYSALGIDYSKKIADTPSGRAYEYQQTAPLEGRSLFPGPTSRSCSPKLSSTVGRGPRSASAVARSLKIGRRRCFGPEKSSAVHDRRYS